MGNDKELIKESLKENKTISTSRIISALTSILVIIVLIFGAILFNIGFTEDTLKEPATWILIGASVPLASLAYKAGIDLMVATRLPNRIVALETTKKYSENIDKLDDDFDPLFLNTHNRNEKKKAYLKVVNKAKEKLSNLYANQSKFKFWQEKISKDEYEKRIEELQEKTTDIFLENNIDKIPVKYKMVFSAYFSKLVKDTTYAHDIDATLSKTIRSQLTKKVISKLAFAILGATIVVSAGNAQYSAFAGLVAINCLIQLVSGLVAAVSIYDSSVLTPMEIKNQIMNSYFAWKLNNPNEIEKIKREAEERVKRKELEATQLVQEEKTRLNLQMQTKIEEIKEKAGVQ